MGRRVVVGALMASLAGSAAAGPFEIAGAETQANASAVSSQWAAAIGTHPDGSLAVTSMNGGGPPGGLDGSGAGAYASPDGRAPAPRIQAPDDSRCAWPRSGR